MTRITVVGAGLAGMSAAFELRQRLGDAPQITVVGQGPRFSFTPSNPWIGVGWRTPEETGLDAAAVLWKRNIGFRSSTLPPFPASARKAASASRCVPHRMPRAPTSSTSSSCLNRGRW